MSASWAILSGDYLNAWGLADQILGAGWQGRVVCLQQSGEPQSLMHRYGRKIEVWRLPSGAPLVDQLASRIPAADSKWLFFTEERSLEEVTAAAGHPWLASATWYPGPGCQLSAILDRLAFYELIAAKSLGAVPRTIPGEADPFTDLGERFFFRYRLTWVRGRRTPRIRLVTGREEWRAAVQAGATQGYGPRDWCYQEVLSLVPADNVSICGWHEAAAPRYVATRKVLQFPEAQGNGDVVERVDSADHLMALTRRLLDELAFTGPFELEFVRDAHSGRYLVIELNPRFWMQHPLAAGNLGQVMVRRYLGLADAATGNLPAPRYWVNTVVALNRLVRADLRGWRYFRHPQAIRVPPLGVTLRWLPRFALNLLHRRLHRG